MLQLYNTLTQKKEPFTSLSPNKVGLYVCGMTVYDHCHMGHARVWIVFDVIVRYLRHLGFEVTYVRNITDVDDKIIQKARELGKTIDELTAEMISSMQADAEALSIISPSNEPRATDYIPHMIQLIQTLCDKGYAYVTPNFDVYYAIDQFASYGKFAHQPLASLMKGARVAVDPNKRHPLDFVLWKAAKAGEPSWDSPWGKGRPGWHIECSAMALENLPQPFDIHGGGADLVFPHHQNEIAQSEAATGSQFAQRWLHVGFVQINQEKMSKSKGNTLSVKALLAEYPSDVIRYFLITSHYRSPITYSEENLRMAYAAVQRLYKVLEQHHSETMSEEALELLEAQHYISKFTAALEDDFNTPVALSVLFEIVHEINRLSVMDAKKSSIFACLLKKLGGLLGFLQQSPVLFLMNVTKTESAWIEQQIVLREQARQAKQWGVADQIREKLLNAGIVLEDAASGTTSWHKSIQ